MNEDLLNHFFTKEDYLYVNQNNIEFCYSPNEPLNSIRATAVLKKDDGSKRCITIELSTDHFDLSEFIADFRLNQIEDLDSISDGHLFDLYILNEAYGLVTCYFNGYLSDDEDISIKFRRAEGRTCIFSEELHFYHEIDEELYQASHFLQYIEQHIETLRWFATQNAMINSLFPPKQFQVNKQTQSNNVCF